MKKIALLFALLVLSLLLTSGFTLPTSTQGGEIYLLIGASNANQGVADAFSARMSSLTGIPARVVVCSQNGSGLIHWSPGGSLYNDCLSRYQSIASEGLLSGVLFVNGEYESKYGSPWSDPFTLLVSNLRADLRSPSLPVIFARVNLRMPGRYVVRVYNEQAALSLENAFLLSTDDIQLRRVWHYNSSQQTIIGQRMAEIMFPIRSPHVP